MRESTPDGCWCERCSWRLSSSAILKLLRGIGVVYGRGERLCAVFKITPGKQYLVAAGQAFQAKVGAQAHHFPLETTERLGFAHFDDVIEVIFNRHP